MSQHHLKQKGFSLIEVMVTVLIVSVGMLAMGSLLMLGIKTNAVSESRLNAAALAQSVATRIATKATVTTGYTQTQATTEAAAMIDTRYTPTVLFTTDAGAAIAATTACSYTVIRVTLAWDDHGTQKTVQLRSGAATRVTQDDC